MPRALTLLAVVLLMAAPARAWGQGPAGRVPPVDTVLVAVRLTDGSEVVGRVTARDDSALTVTGAGGVRTLVPIRLVASWRRDPGHAEGSQIRAADPNTSRLFFAPTGRTLSHGSGYFADYFLFFPIAAVGITDRVMMAGGISIIPGASSQILYLAPKVGLVRSSRLNIAVGGLYATVPGENGYAGAVYGVATIGSEDNALTVVAGYPFANGERTREPGLVFGGETRILREGKLMFEAWKVPGVSEVPAIFGVRFFGRRISTDFGLLHVFGADTEGLPFFPWVDFAVHF